MVLEDLAVLDGIGLEDLVRLDNLDGSKGWFSGFRRTFQTRFRYFRQFRLFRQFWGSRRWGKSISKRDLENLGGLWDGNTKKIRQPQLARHLR